MVSICTQADSEDIEKETRVSTPSARVLDNHQQISKSNNNSKDISGNYLTNTQKKKEKKKQQQQKNLVGSSCEEALGALQELEDMDTCLPSSPHKEKQLDRGPRSPIKAPCT